ncbi:Cerebroside-sulfatase [Planctomycetales bacterium 10988]|nr:Cerebroside-sulfatase [Planctomycetales bacterium 10988]
MLFANRFLLLQSLVGCVACLIGGEVSDRVANAESSRPNVVIIFTDDQGSIDLNCYGAKDLMTPHLDGLAERGVRFDQFYAASAVCSPSRAGLMTGRTPFRAGVPGNVSSSKGKPGMPPDEFTMAEMFKEAGYDTGHVGKWHLGYTPETTPLGQGFDSSFGHMGGCIDNYSHFFYWNGPNRHDLWRDGKEVWEDGKFFPDLMVRECQNFIKQKRDNPFFLYWAINLPHYPLQGTEKWREHYRDLPSPRKEYAAFVSTMDETIGKVLQTLKEAGLEKETIVVFQSDHGHSTEERTFFGGGNAGPYRGAKGCLFEGGIRVPAIIAWPGELPQGEVRSQMVTGCDWLPTLAELTDAEVPQKWLDGKSIAKVIRSPKAKTPHDQFCWRLGSQWAVRQGDWKLLGDPRDRSDTAPLTKSDKRFLVYLPDDLGERTNLAFENPKRVEAMEQIYREWMAGIEMEDKANGRK